MRPKPNFSSVCTARVRNWPVATKIHVRPYVSGQGKSGAVLLSVSVSHLDPHVTLQPRWKAPHEDRPLARGVVLVPYWAALAREEQMPITLDGGN